LDATRIIAIRHGETAWNVDTRIQGQLDIPLNDHGRWQAARVSEALAAEPVAAVYASDLSRAFTTGSAIATALGLAPIPDTGLRERHFGRFQGKTFAEIDANWHDDALAWRRRVPDWQPEGGESLIALRERVHTTASQLAQRHAGEQIVLVAHGGVLDVLYRIATGQELQAPRTWQLSNATINRLLWTPQGFTLVGWDDSRHLDGEALDETHT